MTPGDSAPGDGKQALNQPITPSPCHQCGKVLEPDAVFCPQCGASRTGGVPADSMIGRWIIGQYVVSGKLGEGGMGMVYLADQPSVGRQAVIKVLHPELLRDPSVAPRFEVEARAASQLNHPHIITIYNYGAMDDGTLYLAMEYCNGLSLEHILRQGPLTSERTVAIGAMIADALAEAHRHGVVHRDLKPSNIMLEQVGRKSDFVKVLDFGIAKVEGLKMTRTGTMIGTPQYMSPEQLRGEQLDGRADLYSLGVMLYEMVAGKLPFESDTLTGFMHKHLNEIPRAPTSVSPQLNINRSLESVILRCLEKDARHRISSAEELGNVLEACVSPTAIPLPPISPAQAETSRVGLWLGIFGGALVMVAAAVVLVVVLRSDVEQPQSSATTAARIEGAERSSRERAGSGSGTGSGSTSAAVSLPGGSLARSPQPDAGPSSAAQDAAAPAVVARKRQLPRKSSARATKKKKPTLVAENRQAVRRQQRPGVKAARPPAARARTATNQPVSSIFPGLRVDPKQKAMMAKTVTQLERRLKRVMSTSKMPPSSLDKVLEGYARSMTLWPLERKQKLRKQYLVSLITTYQRPALQLKPHERQPMAEITRIYLSMKTKNNLSRQQRQKILKNVYKTYDQPSFAVKDRPFYRRMALLGLIKSYASDYKGVWKR